VSVLLCCSRLDSRLAVRQLTVQRLQQLYASAAASLITSAAEGSARKAAELACVNCCCCSRSRCCLLLCVLTVERLLVERLCAGHGDDRQQQRNQQSGTHYARGIGWEKVWRCEAAEERGAESGEERRKKVASEARSSRSNKDVTFEQTQTQTPKLTSPTLYNYTSIVRLPLCCDLLSWTGCLFDVSLLD